MSRWRDTAEHVRARGIPVAPERRGFARREAFGRAGALAAAVAALAIAIGLAGARLDESAYPRAALGALPVGVGMLNNYDWGGWLIYAAPQTPVFIDGRLFPFVPAALDDYRVIVNAHPGWESAVARRGVTTMLVRPTDPIATRAVERGWRIAYQDPLAVVLSK